MLRRLFIRQFALIDKAELTPSGGLTVFTGETGAGKSMLIDALSLALGARGGAGFVRKGADVANIEATFAVPAKHPALEIMTEAGIDLEEGELTLRRQVMADNKTRCFANGLRITQTQMKALGDLLADIHGQHDHQLLLKPASHPDLLDRFGRLTTERSAVRTTYDAWKSAHAAWQSLQDKAAARDKEIELLTAYIEELEALTPQGEGEEDQLAAERQKLMAGEQLVEAFAAVRKALSDETDVVTALGRAERYLAEVAPKAGDEVEDQLNRLSEASALVADLVAEINATATSYEPDPQRQDEVEERLFTLRDCARKHHTVVDDLPQKLEQMRTELEHLTHAEENLAHLEAEVTKTRKIFEAACQTLSAKRAKVATQLKTDVEKVLKTLRMENAQFDARLMDLPPDEYGPTGAEKVEFYVTTNPGSPAAPLVKAASGGEVSRLMLALKVVFYRTMPPMALVFDEIDTGVGGAVAEAVGQCMKELGSHHQVFAITHQPQVAACGAGHIRIAKSAKQDETFTHVDALKDDARLDEIARMLSGAEVTKAARDAAASLLKG